MHRPQNIEKVLRKYPIEDVWGIGFRFGSVAEKLDAAAIVAREFAADTGFLQFIHSLLGGRSWHWSMIVAKSICRRYVRRNLYRVPSFHAVIDCWTFEKRSLLLH